MAMVPPDVDFLTRLQPAQLASDVISIVETGACQQYFHTRRGLAFKYLPMRFNISQARSVGRDISLHASLTAYWISGRSGWR